MRKHEASIDTVYASQSHEQTGHTIGTHPRKTQYQHSLAVLNVLKTLILRNQVDE